MYIQTSTVLLLGPWALCYWILAYPTRPCGLVRAEALILQLCGSYTQLVSVSLHGLPETKHYRYSSSIFG